MDKKESYLSRFKGEPIVTTIRLDRDFQADLRMWCIHHHISMAAFLEEAAREKLAKVLEEETQSKDIMGRRWNSVPSRWRNTETAWLLDSVPLFYCSIVA